MELHEVGEGILVARRTPGGFGAANCAAIHEDDGLTVVDATTVPAHAREFADLLSDTGIPIRRLVYTSPHIDHVGGSSVFSLAAVYGTPETSALLDQPPNIGAYGRMAPELADDFAGLTTRPVSHTVSEAAWISARVVAVPVAGQTRENLVVQVPDAGVVLAGAMAAFGAVPAAWAGDPARWADELDRLVPWGDRIVPCYGPPGGHEELRTLQRYLRAVAAGDGDAAGQVSAEWTNQRFHTANLERGALLAAGDDRPPPAILSLMGIAPPGA